MKYFFYVCVVVHVGVHVLLAGVRTTLANVLCFDNKKTNGLGTPKSGIDFCEFSQNVSMIIFIDSPPVTRMNLAICNQ